MGVNDRFTWSNPMTSKKANKYFLTVGFVPDELLEATRREKEKLEKALEPIKKTWEEWHDSFPIYSDSRTKILISEDLY